MLGYFLIILVLSPVITDEVVSIQHLLQPITNYQGYFLTSVFLVPVLLISRILSKIKIEIMDTNIGVFIIVVYVSEIIYSIFSGSYVPFEQLYGMATYTDSEAKSATMLYGSVIIASFLCAILDWAIIKGLMKKPSL